MKVAVYLANGFEEIEALTVVDILRRANIEVDMVSTTGTLQVQGAHNIQVIADVLIENSNPDDIDMIVLPGGMPGTLNLQEHQQLKNIIINFEQKGKYIGAICAAPSILGKLNILKNKRVTCYPGFEKFLYGAEFVEEDVVQNDFIITSRGPSTAIKFSLQLVEVLKGEKISKELSKSILNN